MAYKKILDKEQSVFKRPVIHLQAAYIQAVVDNHVVAQAYVLQHDYTHMGHSINTLCADCVYCHDKSGL